MDLYSSSGGSVKGQGLNEPGRRIFLFPSQRFRENAWGMKKKCLEHGTLKEVIIENLSKEMNGNVKVEIMDQEQDIRLQSNYNN